MTAVDLIVLAILLGSAALGLSRGFVREVFSFSAWVLAFIAAKTLSPWFAPWIPGLIGEASIRYAAAIVLVFVLVLIVASLAGGLVAGVVRLVGLGPYDRLAGLGFGVLRAVVLLLGLAVLAGLTALPRTAAWQEAASRAALERAALELRPWLPQSLAILIRFESPQGRAAPGQPAAFDASTRSSPSFS